MTELHSADPAATLRARNDALAKTEGPQRARNRAQALGVSEAQWVAAQCDGVQATPLTGSAQAIFKAIATLGEVMALTRNAWCVHERHGQYQNIQAEGHVGLVLGPDIDLRVFFANWKHAWAVEQSGRHSIQFFDSEGTAIHKVYCTPATDMAAYTALVAQFSGTPSWPDIEPYAASTDANEVSEPAAFRAAWLAMKDTHDFFPLLRKFKVSRLAALHAAGTDLAQRVPADTAEHVLQACAQSGLPIMCFVGNRGIIQIHTGTIETLRRTGPWFNILDPRFNLHLDTTAIDTAWIVNKPTADGWVTSLEMYASTGDLIVQFFGERKPGKPELPAWRSLLSGMCPQPLAA